MSDHEIALLSAIIAFSALVITILLGIPGAIWAIYELKGDVHQFKIRNFLKVFGLALLILISIVYFTFYGFAKYSSHTAKLDENSSARDDISSNTTENPNTTPARLGSVSQQPAITGSESSPSTVSTNQGRYTIISVVNDDLSIHRTDIIPQLRHRLESITSATIFGYVKNPNIAITIYDIKEDSSPVIDRMKNEYFARYSSEFTFHLLISSPQLRKDVSEKIYGSGEGSSEGEAEAAAATAAVSRAFERIQLFLNSLKDH